MKTVLIVEDNLAYLRQLTESLADFRNEFDLVSAENGAEALNLIERSSVDIVVTDLNMPIMDGFALLSHLHEAASPIPAVVLTGLTRPDVFERLKEYGDLKVLQKPVPPEVFVGTLRTVLEASRETDQEGVTLPELLQTLADDGRSCSLLVEASGRRGSLHFVSGELCDAFIFDEQLDGEAAAAELLRWAEAMIELKPVADDEQARGRFVKTPLADMLAAAYPNLEKANLPQVKITEVQAGTAATTDTAKTDIAEPEEEDDALDATDTVETVPVAKEIDPEEVESKAKNLNLEEHVVASTSPAEAHKTPSQLLAEEASVAELRQQLETEAETLQETFQRLQQRAQEADEALASALGEFETFREQQRSYLAAEEAYQAKRKNLEQWREGAEDLARQLLSAVQQVDEGDDAVEAEDEKQPV